MPDMNIASRTIETKRLLLRGWHESDLADFFEYASVEGVGEMAGWPHHKSIDDTKKILEMFISEKNCFAVVFKENGKVIGSLGLHASWTDNIEEYNGLNITEIGYVLSKDYWGQGLMSEAVKAAIEFCFAELNLDAVACGHFSSNDRSRRVIEKCGFRKVRMGKYNAAQLNKVFDDIQYIFFRGDFTGF